MENSEKHVCKKKKAFKIVYYVETGVILYFYYNQQMSLKDQKPQCVCFSLNTSYWGCKL